MILHENQKLVDFKKSKNQRHVAKGVIYLKLCLSLDSTTQGRETHVYSHANEQTEVNEDYIEDVTRGTTYYTEALD